MKKNFFEGKIRIMLHLLAWAILLALPLYIIKRWPVGNDFIWYYYINTLISGIIFYANYFMLVPWYFFQSRKYKYYLSVCILIISFFFVSDISNKLIFKYASGADKEGQFSLEPGERPKPLPPHGNVMMGRPPFREMHLINNLSTSLFLVFFSLGLRVLERNSKIEKAQKEMEREKLNSELSFLKNQVSPHFFFNTLNNIYSLISINGTDAQNAVLKLSKLMRYMLYESEQGNTKLSSEIDFMKNYIDLMKLRMSDKVALSISLPNEYIDLNVPPLIFIPFIENAFKHGISNREKSFINISMLAEKDSLTFRCVNSFVQTAEETKKEHSGIGLENVSKRLTIMFPGKHDLKINRSDKTYEVLLYINFG